MVLQGMGMGWGALQSFDLHFLLQSLHCFHLQFFFFPLLGFQADTNTSSLDSAPQLGAAVLQREGWAWPACGSSRICTFYIFIG